MADVRPLPGIRYAHGDDLPLLVTPPYDVISPEAQARYYERHPENIIRLELGRDEPEDNDLNNRYTRAAISFAEWRLHGVMMQDVPSLYLYQQGFLHQETYLRRLSLLARVRLEPWSRGVILPHEHTMSRPKSDRLRLLDACAANFSPIMALYEDPTRRLPELFTEVIGGQPALDFKDEVGEQHTLWQVVEGNLAADVAEFFQDRQLYIADGHHRYETCLSYREQQAAQHTPYKDIGAEDPTNFTLMALCDLEDPGLVVLPTHRILRHLDVRRVAELEQSLSPYFQIEPLSGDLSAAELLALLTASPGDTPAAVLVRSSDALLVTEKPAGREAMDYLGGEYAGASAAWRKLDLAVLHELVLWRGLDISPEMVRAGEHIGYTREAGEAVAAAREADTREGTLALLVRSTPPAAIRDVARASERMPQKSTYFYPKLITGLVINPLW